MLSIASRGVCGNFGRGSTQWWRSMTETPV
jgi:hypothetical protein